MRRFFFLFLFFLTCNIGAVGLHKLHIYHLEHPWTEEGRHGYSLKHGIELISGMTTFHPIAAAFITKVSFNS